MPFIIIMTILVGSSSYWVLHSFHSPVSYWQSWATRFCNGFTIAYLLSWVITALPIRWLKILLRGTAIALASLLFLAEGISFGIWGHHISPTHLTLAAETNNSEISLTGSILLSHRLFWQGIGVWGTLLALYFIGRLNLHKISTAIERFRHRNIVAYLLAAATIAAIAFGIKNMANTCRIFRIHDSIALQKWFTQNNEPTDYTDNISRLLFSMKAIDISATELGNWSERQQQFLNNGDAVTTASDSLQVVCVIGESFIRKHSSIYGYPLETTPRLKAEAAKENLVAFTDMATFSPNTSLSVKSILHVNPDGDGARWGDGTYLPAIFRRAGFDVNYNDNQMIDAGSVWTFALASVLLNKNLTEHCYTDMYIPSHWSHDLEFVDSVAARQKDTRNRALSVYHLRGQHLWADYPRQQQWERFTDDDIPAKNRPWLTPEKIKRITDYDNATYYNDSVIAAIISQYRDSESVLVYFSDHGEEIYDYRDAAFRQPPTAGKEQEFIDHIYRVPFMVWMSDTFIARHPQTAAYIRNAANRPGTLAEVSHMLLTLGAIATPCHESTRDIITPAYIPHARTSREGIPIHPLYESGN